MEQIHAKNTKNQIANQKLKEKNQKEDNYLSCSIPNLAPNLVLVDNNIPRTEINTFIDQQKKKINIKHY
ncbi:hypothetical protein M0813_06098 [Anaeramoeba flamelloides]|uniref:Uncharacterized protein n=1 Tax=Anaeramoeba flamelloides TaxID=1746091 RepID=A0ABQ8XFT3_9EUKA|nr:hypothetical protein M0813_06098 [Anaeramoeba flamelloides]